MERKDLFGEKRGNIREILEEFEPKRENLISILHHIQDNENYNYIPVEAVKEVAEYLGVTPAEVFGVISFYTMFSLTPRGKYIIRVCTSAPCYVMGSTTVVDCLEKILGITVGETTEDNMVTLEMTSCLGVCDRAPALMINDEVFGNLTEEKIKEIIRRKTHG
jgi:NADH-quinone oxidoreductase subunit E